MMYKTIHTQIEIEDREGGGELRCPEGLTIPAQHVTPVGLLNI
jgi:hypothetical protein